MVLVEEQTYASFLDFLAQSAQSVPALYLTLHHLPESMITFINRLTSFKTLSMRPDAKDAPPIGCTDVLRVLMPNVDGSVPNPCLRHKGIQDLMFDPAALLQVVEPRLNLCLSGRHAFESLHMKHAGIVGCKSAERALVRMYSAILEEQLSRNESQGFILDLDAKWAFTTFHLLLCDADQRGFEQILERRIGRAASTRKVNVMEGTWSSIQRVQLRLCRGISWIYWFLVHLYVCMYTSICSYVDLLSAHDGVVRAWKLALRLVR